MLSKFNKMLSQKRRRLDEAGNFQVDCVSYCYRYFVHQTVTEENSIIPIWI